MDNLVIIQPGRIGDIIIVLPIAKYYHDQGYKIIWPVRSQYLGLFDYVDYVKSVDLGSKICGLRQRAIDFMLGDYVQCYHLVNDKLTVHPDVDSPLSKRFLDLSIGLGRDETNWRDGLLSFDQWKYKEAGLPIIEKYNLQINREPNKEAALIKHLGLEGKQGQYIVTHSSHASCNLRYDWGITDAIEVRPISSFTVFDWLGVIEGCKAIYCVDSCIANMINQLGIAKGKRVFRSWRQDFDYSKPETDPKGITDPHLDNGWEFKIDFEKEHNEQA